MFRDSMFSCENKILQLNRVQISLKFELCYAHEFEVLYSNRTTRTRCEVSSPVLISRRPQTNAHQCCQLSGRMTNFIVLQSKSPQGWYHWANSKGVNIL